MSEDHVRKAAEESVNSCDPADYENIAIFLRSLIELGPDEEMTKKGFSVQDTGRAYIKSGSSDFLKHVATRLEGIAQKENE